MADLRKTKPEWERFLGREVGFFLACLYELDELERRFSRQRSRVLVLGDPAGSVGRGGVTLAGVDLGRNTSVDGLLYAHVLGGVDPRTLRLYRAPGGAPQALVAEGQGNAGTSLALAPRNQSGLGGQWDLAAGALPDASDRIRLYPVPDWLLRLQRVWDGALEKDLGSAKEAQDMLAAVATRIRDAKAVVREAFTAFATRAGGRGVAFLGTAYTALLADNPVRDASGSVVRRRTGFLPALARSMAEETLAGEQSVAGRTVRAQAAVFAPTNDGRGRVLAHVPREHCPAARWVFTCVRGRDTGYGGREEFECLATVLPSERQVAFSGVRVKQSFSGPEGIGPFLLERVARKANDPQDELLGPGDLLATAGERDGNTDGGLLHWSLEKGPLLWDVSFFRSANRALGDLVARAEGVAPGAGFQAQERNASGLTLTWRLGPQPVDGAEGQLDLGFFSVENRAGLADSFEITTTVVTAGAIQRLLVDELGAGLHGRQAGQETVPDGWIRAGLWAGLLEEGL